MGAVTGKEVVEAVTVVVRAVPPLIMAFQATKSSEKNRDDERISQVLELLQQDRRDINQVLQNQARLEDSYQALALLMNRVEEFSPERQQRTGADGQRGRIRIDIDLPDNIDERNRAMDNLMRVMGRFASDYEREQGNQSAVDHEDQVVRCRRQALASAPPFYGDETESEGQSPEVNPLLCCEVCTQPYNNNERRPTLLPDCGHTFCKECLIKARRRNRLCPACRKCCNGDVENLPTNYSILDFMNDDAEKKSKSNRGSFDDDDDDCKRNKNANRSVNYNALECDMSFEEQLHLATQISLEDYQKNQADEDLRLAQRLQEEEERVMRFSQHEDSSRKRQMNEGDDLERGRSRTAARRQTRLHESSRRNSNRCSGACYDEEEEATRGARRKSYRSDQSYDDDDDVSCLRLSSGEGLYDEARQKLLEHVNKGDSSHEKSYSDVSSQVRLDEVDGCEDGYERNSSREMPLEEEESHRGNEDEEAPQKEKEEFSDDDDDDDDDCCHRSSKRGPYTSAREKLDACIIEGEEDDGYCKDTATRKEDDSCEEDGYAREMNAMLIRAISTHEEDKEKRRRRKYLREQEELELALVLSLSIMPQQQEGQVG